MTTHDYIAVIAEQIEKITEAAHRSPDAPVRACGSWRVLDVVVHLGEVFQFWTTVAQTGADSPPHRTSSVAHGDMDVIRWWQYNAQQLVKTLSTSPPDKQCWTWAGTQTIEWLTRRMAVETVIHAWDVQWAAGLQPTIDPHFASDAIDEFLYVMTPLVREAQPIVGGSVHIHCTDVHGEWLVVPGEGLDMVVTREHAKGSVAIRGSAADILLVLWRRLPIDIVEVLGDDAVAHRFLLRADLD